MQGHVWWQVLRGPARKAETVFEGRLASLRRVKEVVPEVPMGLECGVGVDGFGDWREGDIIEGYEVATKRRTLEEASAAAPLVPA